MRLDAVTFLGTAELYLDLYEEAVAHGRRALAVARATGQGEFFPALVPVVGVALFALGRVAEAAEAFDTTIEAARLSGNAQSLGWSLLNRSMVARVEGDLDAALSLAEESAEVTAHMDRTSLVTAHVSVVLAHALCEAGDPKRAIEVAIAGAGGEELVLIPGGWRASYFELLTRCWLALDRPAEAEAAAARAEAVAADVGLDHAGSMAYRARAAVTLHAGDAALAAEQALAAADAAEQGGRPDRRRPLPDLAGRALAAAGDTDRAAGELERAAAELDACGALRYRDAAEREWRKLGGHPPTRARAKERERRGARRPEPTRARRGPAGGGPPDEPRDRGRALPEREDRRNPHAQHVPQARRLVPRRTRPGSRGVDQVLAVNAGGETGGFTTGTVRCVRASRTTAMANITRASRADGWRVHHRDRREPEEHDR